MDFRNLLLKNFYGRIYDTYVILYWITLFTYGGWRVIDYFSYIGGSIDTLILYKIHIHKIYYIVS